MKNNVRSIRASVLADVRLVVLAFFLMGNALGARAQYPSAPQVTKDGLAVWLTNYARLPASARGGSISSFSPAIDYSNQLARVNFVRSEPANAPLASARFFVNDLNRSLYILNRNDRTFTNYINFQAVFPKFDNDPGFAGGLVTFAFHPEYASNGMFYTVHTENPALGGGNKPINANLPGFNNGGYGTTPALNPPEGDVVRQAVLVEWKDTNINNTTFEGTAREILRVGFAGNAHPMGDMLFNPRARPGDDDYGNLYITCGDGASGEQETAEHTIPQRLDAVQGKILRITPDLNRRPADAQGANNRYRIPTTGSDKNPFASISLSGLKKEIWAYGFRNPHRMSWDPDSNTLLVNDIGLRSWEEVNILRKGANYGYAEREGTEQLFVGGNNSWKTGSQIVPPVAFPNPDTLAVAGLTNRVTPNYPVANYSHLDGDAISSGFVYRGTLMPSLRGKYIFGDITTGRLFYCDLAEMIARDDGVRTSLAVVHELQVVFDSPYDAFNAGPVNRRLFDIVREEYLRRGGRTGTSSVLPGAATVTSGNDPKGIAYGGGRADIRLAMGGDGEIYVLSKSDGMIRMLVGSSEPPVVGSIALSDSPLVYGIERTNNTVTIQWRAFPGQRYRLQFKSSLVDPAWSNVPEDVFATDLIATKTDVPTGTRYYRIVMIPQ